MSVLISPDLRGGLPSGTVLEGRYRIESLLGSGATAIVHGAEHLGMRRHVAIKILQRNLASSSEAVSRFELETLTSAKLDHPNIVSVMDSGSLDDGRLFLVMESLDGETLADLLEREPRFGWRFAIDIACQVALGLAHAHERGIVHRDIKPENIFLVRRDGTPLAKILDFGIAKLQESAVGSTRLTATGLTVGTPRYMSPEQATDSQITPATDLYSLGLVLFEMLTGAGPFDRDEPVATMKAQVFASPPRLVDVRPAMRFPDGLEEVVRQALEKSPDDRMASALELVRLLEAIRDGRPETAQPVAIPTPAPARGMRPWIVGGGFAAAVAMIAYVGTRAPDPVEAFAPPPPIAVVRPPPPAPPPTSDTITAIEHALHEGRIVSPPGANALELLEREEALRPGQPRTMQLRSEAVNQLRSYADRLWELGKRDSARSLYLDVLRLDATNPIALDRSPSGKRAPAIATVQRLGALVAQIDLAILDRRFIAPPGRNALEWLLELRRLDPSNTALARLGGEISTVLDEQSRVQPKRATELRVAAAKARGVRPTTEPVVETAADPVAVKRAIDEGTRALAAGRFDAAASRFSAAIAADARAHAAYAGLAETHFQRGDFSRAVLTARRAVTLAPSRAGHHALLAKSLYKLMRYDEAIAAWERAVTLEPSNASAKQHLAMARAKRGG